MLGSRLTDNNLYFVRKTPFPDSGQWQVTAWVTVKHDSGLKSSFACSSTYTRGGLKNKLRSLRLNSVTRFAQYYNVDTPEIDWSKPSKACAIKPDSVRYIRRTKLPKNFKLKKGLKIVNVSGTIKGRPYETIRLRDEKTGKFVRDTKTFRRLKTELKTPKEPRQLNTRRSNREVFDDLDSL